MDEREGRLATLGALAEPLRRRLYLHVAGQSEAVSRESAAAALGVARSAAAFHLDKLTDAGLLEVEFRRPEGRGGPGAGRPAKCYRRASSDVALSVPERHYEVAASLLAQAVVEAGECAIAVSDALGPIARDHGRVVAAGCGCRARSGRATLARLAGFLRDRGYEPHLDVDTMTLENCPFRMLADAHPELVCTMNLELVEGILDAVGDPAVSARLDPGPGRCCVTLVAGLANECAPQFSR